MTVEALPQPQAIDAVVFADVVSRTLTVRLPDQAGGYERLLWTQAWQQQRRAQERGWPNSSAPWLFADVPGSPRAVHGLPAEGGQMAFAFPVGMRGFADLVARPGLVAILTVDRASHQFLTCRFSTGRGERAVKSPK